MHVGVNVSLCVLYLLETARRTCPLSSSGTAPFPFGRICNQETNPFLIAGRLAWITQVP